jgi:predicted GNAT family N-acyltransferase
MNWRIVIGDWESVRDDAQRLRTEVFVIEQGVPIELEWDESDEVSIHAVVYGEDNQPIATGRLLPDGHIGRMAVQKALRGTGIGSFLLTSLLHEAQRLGHTILVLHAQTYAVGFYLRHGFQPEGSEFMEAGIPHMLMRYQFVA